MLNFSKFIEILISLQFIFISTMVPVFIPLSFTDKLNYSIDVPISFQIPTIILITLIFKKEVVSRAFTIYLFLGLFVIPIFHHGGSVGYLLTPNFGYLIGIYPLIQIIDKLNNRNKIYFSEFIRKASLAIGGFHITGIVYNLIQIFHYKDLNIFFYNLSNYSLSKIGYHLLMLIPLSLLIKPINYIKNIQK